MCLRRRPAEVDIRSGTGTRAPSPLRPPRSPLTLTREVAAQITQHDSPRRLAWKEISSASPVVCIEGCYQLDPAGAGTRFTLRNTYTARVRLATPLLRWVITRQTGRMIPRAKKLAEASAR